MLVTKIDPICTLQAAVEGYQVMTIDEVEPPFHPRPGQTRRTSCRRRHGANGLCILETKVREVDGRRWTRTNHDLNRLFTRARVRYGVEIKNQLATSSSRNFSSCWKCVGTFASDRCSLELAPPARDPLARIDAAFNFVEKLCVTEPIYARANPTVAGHLKACKGFDRVYLAHEYLNRNWLPIPFAEMAKKLARAKLTYACSANLLDFVDAINLTAAQQAFLAEIPDPMFRQSVRDFIVDKQYRRDYWVKGLRRLSTVEQTEEIARQRLILTTGSADIAMRLSSTLGEISLIDPVYAPIIERLADHKPASIGEIAEVLTSRGVSMDRGYVALAILAGKGDLQPARDAAAVEKAKVQTDKFNLYMLAKARGSDQLSFLASPVTGGGIGVSRIQQLFLLARAEGWKTPKEWAEVVVRFFAAHGQTIEKDGRAFQTPEEQLADLCAEATQFAAKRVPILEALQIV